ncbi:MAG TPA: hypothetical protein VFG91_14400, partial [Woeseiaceae bacterium]|nr:hypothetical protein [Woeseiaceae bacterium]
MHKLIAALALFLLSVIAAGDPRMLEPQEFADSYIRQLQSKLPEAEIEHLDTLHLSVGFPGSEGMQVYLDNAWRSYLQNPDSLTAVLDMYTAS